MWPEERKAVLKLPIPDQTALVAMDPGTFSCGPWSHQGWTFVDLKKVPKTAFAEHLALAWRQVALKPVIKTHEAK